MSNKSCFRRHFDKQHGKRSQTLLKSARQHLYHIYWSMPRQLSCKMPLIVICKILALFDNTLTVNHKYSLLNCDNLTQPIQMQFSKRPKTFFDFFSQPFKSRLIFEHVKKRRYPFILCISEITDCERRGLDKCLKSPVSEDPSISGLKNYWNLHDTTAAIFIDQFEGNLLWKRLSWRHAKF